MTRRDEPVKTERPGEPGALGRWLTSRTWLAMERSRADGPAPPDLRVLGRLETRPSARGLAAGTTRMSDALSGLHARTRGWAT